MAKRLNDTAAVKSMPPGGDSTSYESHSVTTRRIENGYLVCESTCKDGEYKSTERYVESLPSGGDRAVGNSSLGEAVKSIRR